MLVLAVEHSTPTGSLALLQDGNTVARRAWTQAPRQPSVLAERLAGLLADAGIEAADVDRFAVGLGPGTYSSLRISLATIQGLALPGHAPVQGVCSARALAYQARGEAGDGDLVVIGDARRARVWMARYRIDGRDVRPVVADKDKECRLLPIEDLAGQLQAADRILSPDWQRLVDTVGAVLPEGITVPGGNTIPDAEAVGRWVAREAPGRGAEAKPLSPIYMHPPVFVAPKFKA